MKPEQAHELRQLVLGQSIAALGTLHEGHPFVSMVPYALFAAEPAFVINVSGLSSHTRDMLESPRVSLLIVATQTPETPAQALARITIQGQAEPYAASSPEHAAARQAYLSRFPQTAGILDLGGFSLFAIRPLSARLIAGFAQARTLTREELAAALAGS